MSIAIDVIPLHEHFAPVHHKHRVQVKQLLRTESKLIHSMCMSFSSARCLEAKAKKIRAALPARELIQYDKQFKRVYKKLLLS